MWCQQCDRFLCRTCMKAMIPDALNDYYEPPDVTDVLEVKREWKKVKGDEESDDEEPQEAPERNNPQWYKEKPQH